MRRLQFEVPDTSFEIALAGDNHEGNILQHTRGVEKFVSYVRSRDNCYWVHMGDWIDAIMTDDRRYMTGEVKNAVPVTQAEKVVEMFRPIADRCICGLCGNHELKLHRFGNLVEKHICGPMGIPYGGYTAHMEIRHAGEPLFNMFLWHGPARGMISSNAKDIDQRDANIKAALKMRLKFKMGDCAIMACGHIHRLIVVPPAKQLFLYEGGTRQGYLEPQQLGTYIDPDRRWYACSGSFLRLYREDVEGYAEIAGYDPVQLGFLSIRVENGTIKDVVEVKV